MQKNSRQLVLMRHARAEHAGLSDAERRLTEHGRAEAVDAGRWLAAHGFAPNHALVSSAVRTRETWAGMQSAAGWDLQAEHQRALYTAGTETALDLIRLLPDTAPAAIVVGHNPTIAVLAQLLSDGVGDSAALAKMSEGYPPGALTVFDLVGDWLELELMAATVTAFYVPVG